MWKNIVDPDTPQMTIWRMRIACSITKAINAHSDYVIIITFTLQQWLQGSALLLSYKHNACQVYNCQEKNCDIFLYNINWRFFITQTEFVYCAVRTEALNILVFNISLLWGSRKCGPVKFGFGRMWWPSSRAVNCSVLTHWGREGSFKLFKRTFPGFLTILAL
jgi:hypothetical protein